jgi:hypothetical protein
VLCCANVDVARLDGRKGSCVILARGDTCLVERPGVSAPARHEKRARDYKSGGVALPVVNSCRITVRIIKHKLENVVGIVK